MRIRKAVKEDFPQVRLLAAGNDLDYDDMEGDSFWVAVEGGDIVGACGLKRHPDCSELRSLVVDGGHRGKSWGRMLVSSLARASREDVYLTTINPDYFEALGFERAVDIPASMIKDEEWCRGCRRDLCRIMVRKKF